jgi:hypothetical protein
MEGGIKDVEMKNTEAARFFHCPLRCKNCLFQIVEYSNSNQEEGEKK